MLLPIVNFIHTFLDNEDYLIHNNNNLPIVGRIGKQR
jgi:hypothetical protein